MFSLVPSWEHCLLSWFRLLASLCRGSYFVLCRVPDRRVWISLARVMLRSECHQREITLSSTEVLAFQVERLPV